MRDLEGETLLCCFPFILLLAISAVRGSHHRPTNYAFGSITMHYALIGNQQRFFKLGHLRLPFLCIQGKPETRLEPTLTKLLKVPHKCIGNIACGWTQRVVCLLQEPLCQQTFQAWVQEMATYVKSLDGTHLVRPSPSP